MVNQTDLIGIDVGGTNLRIGVVRCRDNSSSQTATQCAELIEEVRFQADFSKLCHRYAHAPDEAWQAILNVIAEDVRIVLNKYPSVKAIGIGFPGFIDPVTQCIAQSPNLPGLVNIDLSHDLSRLVGMPVSTENDALAAAYGEFSSRASSMHHMLYLGLGTGVGGGLILKRQPWQGAHGVAMEVGHIIIQPNGRSCGCGNAGCMEQYASASGVIKSYFERTQKTFTTTAIATQARAGDQQAMYAFSIAGESLAIAIAHIAKVIDVRDIVIGGGLSSAWDLMQPAFSAQLQSDLIPALRGKLNVELSTMGDQAGVIGAAMLVHQRLD